MSISIAHTALHDTFHHSENDKQMNPIMASIIEILIDAEEHTANTREIADRCDLSIYSARNWLIRLEEAGFVCRKVAPRGYLWHFTGFNGAKKKNSDGLQISQLIKQSSLKNDTNHYYSQEINCLAYS